MKIAALIFAAMLAAPAPQNTFKAGILQVESFGSTNGSPIIFVPGLACGPWVWDAQIAALAPRHDVLVVSLPGFDGRRMIADAHLMRRAVDSLHLLIASRHLHPIIVGQ